MSIFIRSKTMSSSEQKIEYNIQYFCMSCFAVHLISTLNIAIMMTSSNGNIFRVTGPLCGEFTGPGEFPTQRPVTRSFDVFFDLRLNKRLSKQPWGWWFDTPSWSLWRQCNDGRFVTAYRLERNSFRPSWIRSSSLIVLRIPVARHVY